MYIINSNLIILLIAKATKLKIKIIIIILIIPHRWSRVTAIVLCAYVPNFLEWAVKYE